MKPGSALNTASAVILDVELSCPEERPNFKPMDSRADRRQNRRSTLLFCVPDAGPAPEPVSERVRLFRQLYLEGKLVFDEREVARAMLTHILTAEL